MHSPRPAPSAMTRTRPQRPPLALTLGLAVALVLLVGLATEASRADALGPKRYRAVANTLCLKSSRAIDRIPAPRTGDDVRGWLNRAVPIYVRSVKRIRRLAPPPRRVWRVRHRAWSRTLLVRARYMRRVQIRVNRGADPALAIIGATPRLNVLRARARIQAGRLGLRICSGRYRLR